MSRSPLSASAANWRFRPSCCTAAKTTSRSLLQTSSTLRRASPHRRTTIFRTFCLSLRLLLSRLIIHSEERLRCKTS
eukprot:6481602-Amphidinium_carterae.1